MADSRRHREFSRALLGMTAAGLALSACHEGSYFSDRPAPAVAGVAGAAGAAGIDDQQFMSSLPLDVPVTVGRLPFAPTFCWIAQKGSMPKETWQKRRELAQELISSWQGNSGLEIEWQNTCNDASADVRILLDDRADSDRKATIEGCTQLEQEGPWASYPNEASVYAGCAWNMVLPADLDEDRVVLHTAGHALGLAHAHARPAADMPCPVQSSDDTFVEDEAPANVTGEAFTPYIADYDPWSVMHYGTSERDGYEASSWRDCDLDLRGLSASDALAIEMLYPSSAERSLGGTGWLPYEGLPVFRDDPSLVLTNSWVQRGAQPEWFQANYWTLSGLLSTDPLIMLPEPLIYRELSPEVLFSTEQALVGHWFTDPFGTHHWIATLAAIDNDKHTAVLMTVL